MLEDAAHQIVEAAGYRASGSDSLAEWAEHCRTQHRDSAEAPEASEDAPACCMVEVKLRNEVWGRVHALVDAEAMSATAVALQHAASAAFCERRAVSRLETSSAMVGATMSAMAPILIIAAGTEQDRTGEHQGSQVLLVEMKRLGNDGADRLGWRRRFPDATGGAA